MRWIAALLEINNLKPNEKPGGFSGGCAAQTRFSGGIFGTIAENIGLKCPISKRLGAKINTLFLHWNKHDEAYGVGGQILADCKVKVKECRGVLCLWMIVLDRLLPQRSQSCPHSQGCKPTSPALAPLQWTSPSHCIKCSLVDMFKQQRLENHRAWTWDQGQGLDFKFWLYHLLARWPWGHQFPSLGLSDVI